jgi:long-chain acyl-CoA synthetase
MFNLAVILRESAAARPAAPALLSDRGTMTYADLDTRSDAIAAGLITEGVEPGDRIAVQLPNIPEFPITWFGILKAGAVAVPLSPLLRATEVAYQLTDSAARMLVTWGGVADEAVKGAAEAGTADVFVVGDGPGRPYAELAGAGRPFVMRNADDTAAIVYTSGTTGLPKGAELTHFQLYMNADIPGRLFDIQPDDVILTVLPLFHVFGMSSAMNLGIRFGSALSLVPRFTADGVLATIEHDRATIFDGVPTMFMALLGYPDAGRFDTRSLRVCISGGDSIPARVMDAFEQRFGVPILEGYGMTETASTITFNQTVEQRRAHSVGKPIWGVEVQVWDDDGTPLPPGPDHIGELVTRGSHTLKGIPRAAGGHGRSIHPWLVPHR